MSHKPIRWGSKAQYLAAQGVRHRASGDLDAAIYCFKAAAAIDPAAAHPELADTTVLLAIMDTLGHRPMPADGQAKPCTTCDGKVFAHADALARRCLRCRVLDFPHAVTPEPLIKMS